MVELVDTLDLGSSAARCEGSSPFRPTIWGSILMSIKEIKSGTLYKEYALEIPYEEINKIIDSKINELLPTVSLPGFRKGKAPISIIRKKFKTIYPT